MAAAELWKSAAFMGFNFVVSIVIVWCNKIASNNGFPWTVTLTAFHFLCTRVGLFAVAKAGLFVPSITVTLRNVMKLSVSFIGFVVFNNLSLQFNSIGLYQLLKVCTAPCVILIEFFGFGKTVPLSQLLALVPVLVGVSLATVTTIHGTLLGVICGVLGIFSTSIYQVYVKREQPRLSVNGYQLLYKQSLVSFFMLCAAIPFLEKDLEGLVRFEWANNTTCVAAVVASSVLAFLVNLSIFLVIGRTSPLSYNVLGHAKLCSIILSGYVLFGDEFEWRPFLGCCMAVTGMVTFTHLRLQHQHQAEKQPDAAKTKKDS